MFYLQFSQGLFEVNERNEDFIHNDVQNIMTPVAVTSTSSEVTTYLH
jgi:hypothetical protein